MSEWGKRFRQDLTTKKLVPLKIVYFLISAASAAMMPFLSLHARSLGILEAELGVIFAVSAVFTIIVPTPAGILADKIGNFKVFLSLTLAASGGAAIVFFAVPAARYHHPLPDILPLILSRLGDGPPTLALSPPLHCNFLPHLHNLTITLANCSLCDPTSRAVGGYVPPWPTMCTSQETEAPCEVEVQVHVATSAANASNASFLEVVQWSDAAAMPQGADGVDRSRFNCSATVPPRNLCTNSHVLQTYDATKTFWLYLFVRVINVITLSEKKHLLTRTIS